jgi:ATP-dependent Clp protease ATP-binding subunit ClpB
MYYPFPSLSLDGGWKFARASREGDIQSMQQLLKSGIDVNCRHPLGWTALHTAVINANQPVVEFLVDNGVDINSKDEFSSAPRMASQERTSSTRGMCATTVAMVRDRDFNDSINHFVSYSGFTALHYAVVVDDEKLIRYLLEHGADPTIENNRGLTPSRYCNNDTVKVLLEEYTAKVITCISR